MILTVPYVRELSIADLRLIRLAEFLGITCQSIKLPRSNEMQALEAVGRNGNSCLVINPKIVEEAVTTEAECRQFARFTRLLSNRIRRFLNLLTIASFSQRR